MQDTIINANWWWWLLKTNISAKNKQIYNENIRNINENKQINEC